MLHKLPGHNDTSSIGIIDSRSLKAFYYVNIDRGIDGNKKFKGRKGHIVVETIGLPTGVVVHAANIYDGMEAHMLIDSIKGCYPRLKKYWAKGRYKGQQLIDAVRHILHAEFLAVLQPEESSRKFLVLPLRRIDKRTFS